MEWNISEIERILDWTGEQGFVFATQSALNEKLPNLRLIENPRYLELVRKLVESKLVRRPGASDLDWLNELVD